jgi:1-aminocyclopropane-1-carboxylate deaminase/D-cysteine desulfhydrase-like pyridoxal-dependent ACC family enzyme
VGDPLADAPAEPLSRLDALPRRRLAVLPSPLLPAPALGEAVGLPGLWLKRDDLLGFGFGGHKVRALELLVGDALAQGADALVTGAGPQSNHVRATAAAAAHAGLAMEAVYWGDPPARAEGNLALARLLGARCRFTGSVDRTSVDRAIPAAAEALRAAGRRPYAIPRGGACGLGALGHVLAARELHQQCQAAGIAPAAVVMAAGSGGTLAGWLLARRLLDLPWRAEAVTVSRPAAEARRNVQRLAAAAAALLGARCDLAEAELAVHDGFAGPGYGIPSPEGIAALRLAARAAGVFLDPTYGAKAFAGLMALARAGRWPRGATVVFVHTGGEPALFAQAEALLAGVEA